jgi:hypothetical protein
LLETKGKPTYSFSMQQFPTITSLGLPPEKHADRIVAEMLRIIAAKRAECWPKLHAVLDGRVADGNPAAQQRLLNKMKAAVHNFLLGSHLTPGKRGRYTIRLICLDGWNAESSDLIREIDAIPAKPWIAVSSVIFESKGDFRYKEQAEIALLITHHALSRLTQRCGARDLKEVYGAVAQIAKTYILERGYDEQPVRDGEQLRVKLPYDMGTAVCVLTQHEDGAGGVVVATLWKEGEEAGTLAVAPTV